MDAEYRHALARYHASLRENLLTAVWSRPAHESYSPPCAECPPLRKSHNVVNPLTGRRLGSDPRLPTPEGRDVIRREARAACRAREYLAPPMERSYPVPDPSFHDAQETKHVHVDASRPTARHHSFPTRRPPLNHRGTSSSSFGIRGRVPDHQTGSPAQIVASRAIKTLGREPRQSSFHGFRNGRETEWRGMSSSSSDDDDDDQNEDVPPLSHRSSTSSLAITSPTCPGSPSDPPNISTAPRHSIDEADSSAHAAAKPSHIPTLHLPAVPPTSPFGPLHRPHPSRKASNMTLPTPTTDASESSFTALAPSPFFPPPHTQVDEFPD